ncbi:MAG: AAA family ATPase [Lachnospiraceae bacterium]
MYYVLLDEVQLLREFEAILNSLIRMKNVDVYGSEMLLLNSEAVDGEAHMYPLSFAEFISVYQGTKQDGWKEHGGKLYSG